MSSLLISIFSAVLFTYWFRYTCGLILRAHDNEAVATEQARMNHLNFPDIRLKLRSHVGDLALAPLHGLVERDYQFLRFLVRHTSRSGMETLETRIVMMDYHVMRVWYLAMLHVSRSQARKALEEMTGIVDYLAQKIGEHATSFLEA